MKVESTHKNLLSDYVNLSALLKILRREKFIGTVRFESKGYQAEVIFGKHDKITARENDHISGRIAVGDEVLPRVLIRAHEPGGIISVFDKKVKKRTSIEAAQEETEWEGRDFYEEAIQMPIQKPLQNDSKEKEPKPISLKEKLGLPSLPFSFGKVSSKEIPPEIIEPENSIEIDFEPQQDWYELIGLIGELLQSVQTSLEESNLNFYWVFEKVRSDVFEEFPFLHPNSTVFEYKNGMVLMTEQINNNLFVKSIVETIVKLLERFETHPKYDDVRRSIIRNIIELMNRNHAQYDKFLITQQLERVIDN